MYSRIKENQFWIWFGFITLALVLPRIFQRDFNNYLIFKSSFWHLLQGQNLYLEFLDEHKDFFKYGPSFALMMVPFALLPNFGGAFLWTILGYFLLVFSLSLMAPLISRANRPRPKFAAEKMLFLICLPEFIGNMQNFQTNSMLLSFFIFTFYFLHNEKPIWAAFFLSLSVHIKLFGILLLLFGFLFPRPLRFWCWCLFWILLMASAPLAFISLSDLSQQYFWWLELLKWDNGNSLGISLMGVTHALTGWQIPNQTYQMLGGIMLSIPFLFFKKICNSFKPEKLRSLLFSSVLIWMILFNHKSESPTFIIGIFGLAVWYLVEENKKLKNWGLALGLFFISFLYSDLISEGFKKSVVHAYELKAWPLIGLWFYLQFLLLRALVRRQKI